MDIEWTLILQFCFLNDYIFLLDASIFTTIDEKKEEQKSTLQIFLKGVTGEKMWKFINTVNSQKFENSKNWSPINQTTSQITFKANVPSEKNF